MLYDDGWLDFDKAVKLLEGKLLTRVVNSTPTSGSHPNSRQNLRRSPSSGGTGSNNHNSSFGKLVKHEDMDADLNTPGSPAVSARMNFTRHPSGKFLKSGSMSMDSHRNHQQPHNGIVIPQSYYQELEDQLADALFRRAQAKLMLEVDPTHISSALTDARRVSKRDSLLWLIYIIMCIYEYACMVSVCGQYWFQHIIHFKSMHLSAGGDLSAERRRLHDGGGDLSHPSEPVRRGDTHATESTRPVAEQLQGVV